MIATADIEFKRPASRRIHEVQLKSHDFMEITKSVIISTATCGQHLRPSTAELQKTWNTLEEHIIRDMQAWFVPSMRKLGRLIMYLPTMSQIIIRRLHSLEQNVQLMADTDRATTELKQEPTRLKRACRRMITTKITSKKAYANIKNR